ncbi:Elongation factor 1-gamma [Geodia barretti]|uniref:Elongation factor 1-gamma n=1 Tax=Geodia barretti TaxID=519541 RepID=A0AA35SN73_GEOBA|nr:Elongation factor 1-gamma [Geodia barretti]
MAGTLYTYPESFRANKVLIAARYSGAAVKVVCDPPQFELGVTNHSPEFLAKFPLGKVPAFETSDGSTITESNAIAYYVANSQLRGTTDLDAARILQYINFADSEVLPSVCTWTFPTLGIMQPNQQAVGQAQAAVKRCLEVLDSALATRTFLVGERVTLADITLVCNLLLLYKQVLDPGLRAPYVNVNRWFATCVNQPQFKAVLGDVPLCTKMAVFDAKKYNELFPKEKKEKAKKGGGEAKEESGKGSAKKQQKSDTHKKKEAEPPAEEDDAPKTAKFVDPYLSLPPSPFIMDAFKRVYSNEDIETKAIPYLWENFDKEGWSLWRADYRYNNELKMSFMAANLIGGMFQRVEKLHKYGFGSVLVFGEDYKLSISGIWLFRGQQLAFNVSCVVQCCEAGVMWP